MRPGLLLAFSSSSQGRLWKTSDWPVPSGTTPRGGEVKRAGGNVRPKGPRRVVDGVWCVRLADGHVIGWCASKWYQAPPILFAPGEFSWTALREHGKYWKEVMKKPAIGESLGIGDNTLWVPSKGLKLFPHADELLTKPCWDDSTLKGEVTLWLSLQPGFCKALLALKGMGIKSMITGRTWDDLWACLDLAIKTDSLPWQPDGPARGKAKGK